MHDLFIKQAITKPKAAREFFESYLPAHIREKVDLKALEPQKESFIEKTLGIGYVDMLFKVKFGEEEGYLLLEQQSKSDRNDGSETAEVMLQICSNHLEKHEGVRLFYTGKARYNTPLTLRDLFNEAELAKSLFVEPFQLIK